MKELSIFVDESGDFGKYVSHSPFYLITILFHNQSHDISSSINLLNARLSRLGLSDDFYIHVGPAIRREGEYRNLSFSLRRQLVASLMAFFRDIKVEYKVVSTYKKHNDKVGDVYKRLAKEVLNFVNDNYHRLCRYDIVKIYYDNGQIEITKLLSDTFGALLNNTIFYKVIPKDYKLAQAADLACTLELVDLKRQKNISSKSEAIFFQTWQKLKKNYLKPLRKQRLH